MTVLPFLAFVWWTNGSPIQVEGGSRCPAPAEIAARLPDLLPAVNADDPDRDSALVETDGADLLITLRGSGGEILLRRRIAGDPGGSARCEERAAAAAVVIATWEMDRRPQLSPPLPAPPTELHPPIPTVRADLALVPAAPGTLRATGPRFDLALALGTSASTIGLAGTGDVELGARARTRRWGVGVTVSSDTERQQTLDGGVVKWRRMAVGLGPSFLIVDGPLAFETRAQLLAGFLMVRGQGYDENHETSDLSLGLAGALRVLATRGRIKPFLEVGARTWLGARNITIAAGGVVAARMALPRVEERLTAGLRVLFGD